MRQQTNRWLVALAMSGLLGCGGGASESSDSAEAETTGGEGDTQTSASAGVAWGEMDQEQRFAFMQGTVMPEMQALFQEHDAERFADFSCATCHGDDAREVHFSMPNGVSPLDPNAIGAMFASEDPMAQFMTQRVWPRMAELLQEAPFNPETGQGFSCLNCHATAEGS